MKKYDVILFDLDGTLTNPEHGLIESYYYGLSKMGVKNLDKAELKRFIGPPLFDEWQIVYGFTPEESHRAVNLFREYFSVFGWWDNVVYPGIERVLSVLKNSGKRLALATSKPEVFARKILKHFSLDKYFDFIGAATLDTTRDKKWQVIEYTLLSLGVKDKSGVILVGDRMYDAEGARICGIDSLGVLYGQGTYEEITSAGFTHIVNTVDDILSALI